MPSGCGPHDERGRDITPPLAAPTARFTSNLQAIRIIAAFLILLRHSFVVLGDDSPLAGVRIPSIGIWVFFTISGYLLPGSWVRHPHLGHFLRARLRRLMPSLAVVVAASALILGPILSWLPASDYFSHPTTWAYFSNLVFQPSYFLPGVFEDNPYPNAVNGSIWSLPPQALTYALIPIVFLMKARGWRIAGWAALLAFAVWDNLNGTFEQTVVWGSNVSQALIVIGFFAAGALIRELRVPLRLSVTAVLVVLLIIGMALLPGANYLLMCLVIPYGIITISLQSWPGLRAVNRFPDISYGVFLVGFPVQQTVIATLPDINPYLSIGLTVVVSTVLALFLELCVDRPIVRAAARRSRRKASDRDAASGSN
ncbi:acyltransferase [Leucobacter rhizosphaerae]|uniref:Acyltransferase n=1 Tax=Leucobacter rhizosphaerae TaxID=2932245 RepID=A0ABY4FUD3_9MICO|nr:acyltransferase [Leucobacter rhizosphaerae]UOQ59913.1 acyltransferase [Leucobacter rhizosphaerae]